MGLFDKMKEKAVDVVSQQADNLKEKSIGGKNIGEMVKPLEGFAETAAANRAESKKEQSITLDEIKLFNKTTALNIRRDVNDKFYFSKSYSPNEIRYDFQSIEWAGPQITTETITKTTGTTKQKGRTGSALVGGALLGGVGAVAGAARGKKGTIDTTSTSSTNSIEKPTKAIVKFKNLATAEYKEFSVLMDSKAAAQFDAFTANLDSSGSIYQPVAEAAGTEQNGASDYNQSIEQIKKLKELLDAGILTQEEFDTKKRDLLGL